MNKPTVKQMKTKELKPNPRNPRLIDAAIEPVAKSIKEYGFLVPIVVNEDNVVLSGHARLAAAKSLEMEKVPTIIAKGLSDSQQNAFMLADNRLSENASYDMDKLTELLKELTDVEFEMESTGFTSDEIDAFISNSTSDLDDILGLSEEEADEVTVDASDGNDAAEEDTRHMHRMMLLLNSEQRDDILEAINKFKSDSNKPVSNGECVQAIALEFLK